jgi:hypothetical protein
MPGTHVPCVDRVPNAKIQVEKRDPFIQTLDTRVKSSSKPEQQQQDLGSFAQYGFRNRDSSHGDRFK